MESLRKGDVNKLKADMQRMADEHEVALTSLRCELNKQMELSLTEQKVMMEGILKNTIIEKDRLVEKAKESFIASQSLERETVLSNLRTQQEGIIEKQRDELERIREDMVKIEINHQNDMRVSLEQHLQELSTQRNQLEVLHEKEISSLKDQIIQMKDKLNESFNTMNSRQTLELKALRQQREEFDNILQTSLNDRDVIHKDAMKTLSDNFEAERSRLISKQERERVRIENELIQKEKSMISDIQKLENVMKDKTAKEITALEEKHNEAIKLLLSQTNKRHKEEIQVMELSKLESEKYLQEILKENNEKQQELTIALAKMRAQYEIERSGLSETIAVELQANESKQRETVSELKSQIIQCNKLLEDTNLKLTQLELELEDALSNVDIGKENIITLQLKHETEIVEIKNSLSTIHKLSLDEYQLDFENRIQRVNENNEVLINNLQSEYEEKIENLIQHHNSLLSASVEENELKISNIREDHRLFMENLASREEAGTYEITQKYELKLKLVTDKYDTLLESMKTTSGGLESMLRRCEEELREMEDEVEKERKLRKEVEEKRKVSEEEHVVLMSKMREDMRNNHVKEMEMLTDEVMVTTSKLKARITSLEEEKSLFEKSNSELLSSKHLLESENQHITMEIDGLQQVLGCLQTDCEKQKMTVEEAWNKVIDTHETWSTKFNECMYDYNAQLLLNKTELDNRAFEIKGLTSQLEDLKVLVMSKESISTSMSAAVTELNKKIEILTVEKTEIKEEFEKTLELSITRAGDIAVLESRLEDKEGALATAKTREKELLEVKKWLEDEMAEERKLQDTIEEMKTDLVKMEIARENERNENEEKIIVLRREIERLVVEVNQGLMREEDMCHLHLKVVDLQTQLNTAVVDLSYAQAEVKKVSEDNVTFTEQIKRLREELVLSNERLTNAGEDKQRAVSSLEERMQASFLTLLQNQVCNIYYSSIGEMSTTT